MAKLLSLLLLAASCNAGAIPFGRESGGIEKRQSTSGLVTLLSASIAGKFRQLLGEPEGTEALVALARILGATKTSPGLLERWNRDGLNAGYGIVADPAGAAPRRITVPSRTNGTGASTVKIRYGPYKVANMNVKNSLGEGGMLYNYPHSDMEKPCSGDCTVIGMNAGLELPDGTNANIHQGLWLHHLVMFNVGPGRQDPTCLDREVSLPHVSVGSNSHNSERFFASGNERSTGIFPEWGVTDVGYKLKSTDRFAALVELMNENMEDKVVYLTITYDILDGHPFKDNLKIVWFDIRQCGTSEATPPKGQNRFTLNWKWKSTIEGEVIGSIGHLHDGGTTISLNVDGQTTCTNVAKYGTNPDFVQEMAMGHHSGGALTHISELHACYGPEFPHKTMRVGQTWSIDANYDFGKYMGMKQEDGSWEEVMGIAIAFVRQRG